MNTALFILLVVLFSTDVWSTYKILKLGGTELNPIVRWFISEFGLKKGLGVAWSISLGVTIILYIADAWYYLAALCGLIAWVVTNNLKVLRKLNRSSY